MSLHHCFVILALIIASSRGPGANHKLLASELRGEIRDADSGELLPARISIQSAEGAKWFFARVMVWEVKSAYKFWCHRYGWKRSINGFIWKLSGW